MNNKTTSYYSVFFASRNKDNKHLDGFKPRSKSFLTEVTPQDESFERDYKKFKEFVNEGVVGELSRWYLSVNNRDIELANKNLVHYLIDNPSTPPHKIYQKLVSFASQEQCAISKKWMFDFDEDTDKIGQFISDIETYSGLSEWNVGEIKLHKTISGFNVITSRGFDTRGLLKRWDNVELHRDGSFLLKHATKERAT